MDIAAVRNSPVRSLFTLSGSHHRTLGLLKVTYNRVLGDTTLRESTLSTDGIISTTPYTREIEPVVISDSIIGREGLLRQGMWQTSSFALTVLGR